MTILDKQIEDIFSVLPTNDVFIIEKVFSVSVVPDDVHDRLINNTLTEDDLNRQDDYKASHTYTWFSKSVGINQTRKLKVNRFLVSDDGYKLSNDSIQYYQKELLKQYQTLKEQTNKEN